MQFVDLCRNLVCAQFPGGEQVKVEGYMRYWRPIELWAMAQADVGAQEGPRKDSADAMLATLDALLRDFLKEECLVRGGTA